MMQPGEARSDGPAGIASWFDATDYNEESIFVRHAYFLFRCKCPVVSRVLGRPEGDLIVLDGDGAG